MARRREELDWLRGALALSVLSYHCVGTDDASTLLGKLGIYAVSMFFVISGLSIALAYDSYITDIGSSFRFLIRRLFRILPLLWLCVGFAVLLGSMQGVRYGAGKVLLSLTGLFGFVKPTAYMVKGGWSIGNELVYYALTPFLIYAFHLRRWLGFLITGASFAVALIFAFYLLDPGVALPKQWSIYINPLNNLFLYCAGLAFYYGLRDIEVPRIVRGPLFVLILAAFVAYPATGHRVSIVTGFNRVSMSSISMAIVFAFYKCAPALPQSIGKCLRRVGEATYGVYLLHPFVNLFVVRALSALHVSSESASLGFTILLTATLAWISYRWMEYPIMQLGKRITQNRNAPGP